MVLLILALIWAVVLIPPALRNRAEGRPSDSIAAFRRQLAVLNKAGPRLSGRSEPEPRPVRPAGRPASALPTVGRSTTAVLAPSHRPSSSRAAIARREARRRRRDVLVALLVAAGTTLALGAVPALRVLWIAHIVVDVLLVAYVALLVRQRNLAAERDLKVRFLPGPRPVDDRAWTQSESAWLAN